MSLKLGVDKAPGMLSARPNSMPRFSDGYIAQSFVMHFTSRFKTSQTP